MTELANSAKKLLAAGLIVPALSIAAGKNWLATNPSVTSGQQSSDFLFRQDLRQGWADGSPSSLFWVRLSRAAGAGFQMVEVAPRPITRAGDQEEILVIDAEKREAHPAYDAVPPEKWASGRLACDGPSIATSQPYTVCNSVFAAPPSAAARLLIGVLSGGQSEVKLSKVKGQLRIFDPDKVAAIVNTPGFEESLQHDLPAATQARARAIEVAQAERHAAAVADQARLRLAADNEANERLAVVARLRKLRTGYKDVCEYVLKPLDGGLYAMSERLKCINLGEVPNLETLKQAGFIVTSLQERELGARSSTRFTVEKFD